MSSSSSRSAARPASAKEHLTTATTMYRETRAGMTPSCPSASRRGRRGRRSPADGVCEHSLEVDAFGERRAGRDGIEGDAEYARRLRRRRGVVDKGGVAIDPGEQREMTREPLEPAARPAIDKTRRTPRRRAARVEQTGEHKVIEGLRGAGVLLDRVVVGGRRVRSVAADSVSAAATNVPTSSVSVPSWMRASSSRNPGAAASRASTRAGSIAGGPPFLPDEDELVHPPQSRTACGNTSMKARTIDSAVAGGTCDSGSDCVR